MLQKTKRTYRTIKEPAGVSKNATLKEAEKAAKEYGKKEINEYHLRYITSSGKKNPFLKGGTIPTVKEETIFAKTDESAKKKARFFIRQAYKKSYVCHSILDKIKRKCIALGHELGEKF
jgi:hypothetical protein